MPQLDEDEVCIPFAVPRKWLCNVTGALPGTPPLVLAEDVEKIVRTEVSAALWGGIAPEDREAYLRTRFPGFVPDAPYNPPKTPDIGLSICSGCGAQFPPNEKHECKRMTPCSPLLGSYTESAVGDAKPRSYGCLCHTEPVRAEPWHWPSCPNHPGKEKVKGALGDLGVVGTQPEPKTTHRADGRAAGYTITPAERDFLWALAWVFAGKGTLLGTTEHGATIAAFRLSEAARVVKEYV